MTEDSGHSSAKRLWDDRFRSILNSALDAVITMDTRGTVVDWNRQAEEVFGWTKTEAEGRVLSQLIIPEDQREAFHQGLERYAKTGEAKILGKRVELTAQRRDGETLPVEMSVVPIPVGDTIVFNAFLRDVTIQRKVLRESRESREQLHLILESTAEAIYGIDLNGKCTFCNPATVRMLGYDSTDELLGKPMHELIHHTRVDGTPYPVSECHIYSAVVRGEGAHIDDEILWRKDGSSFPAEYWSYPIRRENEIIGAVVTFLDISERLADQQRRARLAAIVDSSYDAIIGKDKDGTIISWNMGAEKTYGFAAEEAINQHISLILRDGETEEEREILHAMRTGQRLEQFETIRRRKDGQLIYVSLTVSPMTDAHGQIVGSSTIERDITDRKLSEEELRESKDTAERARETSERAMRTRSEFLANVSHELRTPMNAILGMLQLSLEENLSAELRDQLTTAKESADSLLVLLNDILDFSRLESGKFTIEEEPFELRDAVDEAVKTLSSKAYDKGLELACEVASDVPEVVIGDDVRIRQLIVNLVNNGIKFTEQGEVVVRIDVVRLLPRDVTLRFSVRDTGIGISPTNQKQIFSAFAQVDASSTRTQGGVGLGLPICDELLRLMGSHLSVNSKPGQGSEFCFTLTLRRLITDTPGDRDSELVVQLKDRRVLVVDDNATIRDILKRSLQNWSMQPLVAKDGKQALELLRESDANTQRISLAVVDALMPGMDGFQLAAQLDADPNIHTPPIVLMISSTDRQAFTERQKNLPISTFLSKPVTQSDLLDAVITALELEMPASSSAVIEPTTKRRSQDSLSVLIAEDTPANQKVVTSILKKRGHGVTIANNGREALELATSNWFDVILMDVQMPIMDGYQATVAIREAEKQLGRQSPIIAMTAHAMKGDREKCLQAGMDAYISKPIDVSELVESVESIATNEILSSTTSPVDTATAALREDDDDKPSSVTPDPTIDLDAALRRVGGDRELLSEFVAVYFEDSPILLQTIRDAVQNNDAPSLHRSAHSLKGLAANFSAAAVVDAAAELESRGKLADLDDAPTILERLEVELRRLNQILRSV